MRSRTELVTTRLEDSEFEDESDFEDSEEDWQPAKGEQKTKKIRATYRAKKVDTIAKGGSKKQSRKPEKRVRKITHSDSEIKGGASEMCSSEQASNLAKKPRKSINKKINSTLTTVETETAVPTPPVKSEPTTSAPVLLKPQPQQRKVVTPLKSFPDKCGYLSLYIFKGDLKDGIINNPQVCLWRRDGSSLLQKYLRDKTVDSTTPQFNSCMVYSCWEDKRADEYLEVKVKCIEQSKEVRVELTNATEIEAKSRAEYDNYVAVYGVPPTRTLLSNVCNNYDENHDDDDDDNIEYDEADEGPEDGEGEGSEDTAQEE